MQFSNNMTVMMKNHKAAIKALNILNQRLSVGFDCDSSYKKNPSMLMQEHLKAYSNTVYIENVGCYTPEDAEIVFCDLLQYLAENLPTETFSCKAWYHSTYTSGSFDAEYKDGELNFTIVYYPEGYSTLYCQNCGEAVCEMRDYEDGWFTSYCSNCDEETDFAGWIPITSKKSIKIV